MTPAVLAAIRSNMLRPALFVMATFVSGPVYLWSGLGKIVWNGQTWCGIGTLGSVSTVEESSSIDAKGITLTLSGLDPVILADIMTEFQVGLPAIVWVGFFDETNTLIPDPLISFSGRMDQPTLDVSGTTSSIAINCEGRLFEMNVAVDRRYTDEDQQLDFPGDLGMSFVNSIQQLQIYWGRTPSSKNNL